MAGSKTSINRAKKTRAIKPGGGRHRKLTVANEILLNLFNLHPLPKFQMLGLQFEGRETTANDIFHPKGRYCERIITSEPTIKNKKNESEWLWVEEIILELELIVDSYEQPRASPTDSQKQKKSYEGIAKKTYI